ncbi:MAG: bifunctional glycosyltransferase family 2/GtrA family protein [Bacteroidota bacterium]
MTIPILIPAFEPDNTLIFLINKMVEAGINDIIVIDDGSGPGYIEIFNQIRNNKNCHLCTHAVNLGKGRAIKTGLNFALNKYPQIDGIVTADADGQHLPEDILKVRETLSKNPDNLIIGCRSFNENIPFRSKLGNEITKIVFRLLTGIKVSDTQTGLRGIPYRFIPECIRMEGERYEYEINMLISCSKNRVTLKEVPIKTVYIEQNRSSHFNPVLDSLKIYFVLFRFLLSSLTTTLIDFLVFIICSNSGMDILLSTVSARLVAGNYNFAVNRSLVFKSHKNFVWSFIKYWLLVALLGCLSYLGISALVDYMNLNLLLLKALVETLLFFVSFTVQRSFVFPVTYSLDEKN